MELDLSTFDRSNSMFLLIEKYLFPLIAESQDRQKSWSLSTNSPQEGHFFLAKISIETPQF
jgi:hypothetical protein